MGSLEDRQRLEIEYWRTSPEESPESDSIRNIINKVSEAAVFMECLQRHDSLLVRTGRVLELGGGQGWAACLYKRLFPTAYVILTDISEYAIASRAKWEDLWKVTLDDSYACASYQTREQEETVDLVFCFASAHHFLAHRKTLREIHRVLRPGGLAAYFYEPTAPTLWYPLAKQRVNRKRPQVPEDVLVVSKMLALARESGLNATVDYFPSLLRRGQLELLYYAVLSRLPLLQRLFPCTANLIFRRPGGA